MAHNEINDLKESTKKMLPDSTPCDLVAQLDGNSLFLTHVFKGGFILGFWSHSPWGTCNDQEQGWALLDSSFKEVTSCETKTMGLSAGNDFLKWRRKIKDEYGKATKLSYHWDNCLIWKISEC